MYDVVYRDRAVYLPPVDALVLADLHLGRATASSVSFPIDERRRLRERVAGLLSVFEPSCVVLAGDVLDRFDHAAQGTETGLAALLDACVTAGVRPVLVAGNHDTVLAEVTDRPVHDAYRLDDAVVCHGHEVPASEDIADGTTHRGTPGSREGDTPVSLYVVGHDHPAIDIEGQKRPCYLYGAEAHAGADLLVLPAFTELAAGTTVNRRATTEFLSPFVTDADALRPVVRDEDADETLTFPPLGEFRHLL